MDMIDQNILEIKRHLGDTKLIVVSKNQDQSKIDEVLGTGHRIFGENRVQEAKLHWGEVKDQLPDLKLHLIGPLQTNKAAEAVRLFDVIQTLDRKNLVDALEKEVTKQKKHPAFFIQVNTGEESQKAGVSVIDFPGLLSYARGKGLNINGLMCIPPVQDDPARHFSILRGLAEKYGLRELSMGMSGDYKIAIKCGASYVRIGSSIFGSR